MAAATLDILIEQGATFGMRLRVKDSAGDYIDVTGWTFRGQVRSKYSSSTSLAAFTPTIPTQTGDDLGAVDLAMADSVTAAIPVDAAKTYEKKNTNYVYDVEAVDTGSKVYRLVQGKAEISPEVTRP